MEHNYRVIKLVTDRYSKHVQSFNHLPDVTEADSDRQYDLNRELESLARAAFARAPEFKPPRGRLAFIPAQDLGNAYRALRKAFTPEERDRYSAIQDELNALTDKYEG